MASIQTASVNTLAYLQRKNKITYVSLVVLLSIFFYYWIISLVILLGDTSCRSVPGIDFCLSSGQAHPKFNKKVSKYLLQYSVVGLGFGE